MNTNESGALMRAVAIKRFGGVEELRLMELPVPSPGTGEVLIGIAASGVKRCSRCIDEQFLIK